MNRFRCAGSLLATTFVLLVVSLPLFSQGSNNGRILGTVTDQTGGVIAGATVTITDTARGTTRTLTADSAGEYNAPELIPGIYTVRAEFQGFTTTERQNVMVEVGGEIRVDLKLQPGQQNQTVTVTEALPLVETASATLGGTISNQLIADLPVQGRNFTKLLELRPGVYLSPGSGKWSQSSNGMRNEHNVYILDGIDSIEGFSSQSVVNATGIFGDATAILPIDAIEEFATQEVPKAEYGWKPGAIVSVGLKSGTNTIHGSAYAFGRASALDAANPFLIPGTPKQETDIKDFGGTVGGRIVKDKLFYFLAYEGQRNLIGSPSASISLPTTVSLLAAGQSSSVALSHSALDACNALTSSQLAGSATPGAPSPLSLNMAGLTFNGVGKCVANSNNTSVFQNSPLVTYSADPVGDDTLDGGLSKIDYHPNDKNTISGEYFAANFDSIAPQNNGAAQDYWDTSTHAKSMVMGLHWTWVPNSSVVNELRGGFNRYNQQSFPADCLSAEPHPNYGELSVFNSDANPLSGVGLPANCGFPNITITGFTAMGCCSSFPKIQGPDWTKQAIDDVSYIRGRHALKFGFEVRNLAYQGGTYGGSKGAITFSNLTNFLLGSFTGSTSPSVLVGQPGAKIGEWGYAAYAQDDWRITDRIIVNAGLRYETVTPFTAAGNQLGNFDPNSATGLVQANGGLWKRNNDFSPRLGVAWDIRGDSKWVVRAGFSMIYVIEGYNAFVSQQGLAGISVLGLNFDPTGALLNGVAGPGNIQTGQVVFPTTGPSTGGLNWTGNAPVFNYPASGIRCDSPVTGVSPNNKPCPILAVNPNFYRPYAPSWNLSFQHAFSNTTSLQVAYVGSHGTGLFSLNDVNAPPFGAGWATFNAANGTCTPLSAAAIATTVGASSSTTPSVNTTCENIARPYFSKFPYLSNIIEIGNQDESNYDAMQVTFTQRPWHGLSDLVGFTWAHSLEDASGDWNGSTLNTNPFNIKESYGNSSNDVRDRLTVSISYALPEKKGYKQLLEGWGLNSVVNVQSALPYTVTDATNDISGLGDKTDWWDFVGDPKAFNGLGSGYGTSNIPYVAGTGDPKCLAEATALDAGNTPLHPGWTYTNALAKYGCYELNGSMLLPPAFGTLGDAGRGLFRGVGLKLWDLSLTKQVRFTERISGQFRFEAFNILNHTNYAPPSATMVAGITSTTALSSLPSGNLNFGRSTATPDVNISNPSVGSGAPRGFQMGLRLAF